MTATVGSFAQSTRIAPASSVTRRSAGRAWGDVLGDLDDWEPDDDPSQFMLPDWATGGQGPKQTGARSQDGGLAADRSERESIRRQERERRAAVTAEAARTREDSRRIQAESRELRESTRALRTTLARLREESRRPPTETLETVRQEAISAVLETPVESDGEGLSVEEVAELIGRPYRTVLHWCDQGKVRATKVGRRWIIPIDEVQRLIAEERARRPKSRRS